MNKFAVIASRFNELIVNQLVKGAFETLKKQGVQETHIEVIWVPGALEIPIVAQRVAKTRQFSALICLGAVIKGSTDHYEHVSREVHHGITRVSLDASLPITMGVLTVQSMDQALERAGGVAGNVGSNAALAAFEVVNTLKQLGSES